MTVITLLVKVKRLSGGGKMDVISARNGSAGLSFINHRCAGEVTTNR